MKYYIVELECSIVKTVEAKSHEDAIAVAKKLAQDEGAFIQVHGVTAHNFLQPPKRGGEK